MRSKRSTSQMMTSGKFSVTMRADCCSFDYNRDLHFDLFSDRGDCLMANKPRMLEGYRVLDFTQFVAGPTCTRLLGEMGAEVIKLELAPDGDRVRAGGLRPLKPEHRNTTISSYYLQHAHRTLSFA